MTSAWGRDVAEPALATPTRVWIRESWALSPLPRVGKSFPIEQPEDRGHHQQYNLIEWPRHGREPEHTSPPKRPWYPAVSHQKPQGPNRATSQGASRSHGASLGRERKCRRSQQVGRHPYPRSASGARVERAAELRPNSCGVEGDNARSALTAASFTAVADFWVVTHREHGAIANFATREEAEAELARVFGDEPTWRRTMSVEPFELVVADVLDLTP